MHYFEMKKYKNFLDKPLTKPLRDWKRNTPLHTLPLSALSAPRCSRLRRSTSHCFFDKSNTDSL